MSAFSRRFRLARLLELQCRYAAWSATDWSPYALLRTQVGDQLNRKLMLDKQRALPCMGDGL